MMFDPESRKPADADAAGSPKSSERLAATDRKIIPGLDPKWNSQRRWKRENPMAVWCHSATASAIRYGLLERGPCAVCGKTDDVELHHERWDRPLETVSLCGRHHRIHHRTERRRQKGGAG
jgi:hypothetical protein